jgi:hypothetical protein
LNATELYDKNIKTNSSYVVPSQVRCIGTVKYAPINAHLPGSNYNKRDDLEAMLYVLKHLRTHKLPWTGYDLKSDEG